MTEPYPIEPQDISQLAEWLLKSTTCVCFSGAGISTESGIPDFRSPGGVWSRRRTVMFDEFLRDSEARFEYWDQKSEAHDDMERATPNIAHELIATWETEGRVRGVVTQNIDGLHQEAGSRNVFELHGSARRIHCLSCGWSSPADPLVCEFRKTRSVPDCPQCHGLLKHATISFGQSLDSNVLQSATSLCYDTDLLIVFGSSLVVEPAASLPRVAKRHGARVVILNREPTPHDEIADMTFQAEIGQVMTALRDQMGSSG